jgi:hypothetical protein
MPNENVLGWQFESSENDLATISYGLSQSSGSGSTATRNWNVGLSASNTAAVSAPAEGPAFSVTSSMSVQYAGVLENSVTTTTTLSTSYPLKADVNVNKTRDTAPQGEYTSQIGINVMPYGAVWATGSQLSISNYQFFDATGAPVSDGSSSTLPGLSMTTAVPLFSLPIATNITPYMVTPGSPLSYMPDTPNGINATMAALAAKAGTPGKLPGGVAFQDYFEDIIYPMGLRFSSGQNYLLFQWSTGAPCSVKPSPR